MWVKIEKFPVNICTLSRFPSCHGYTHWETKMRCKYQRIIHSIIFMRIFEKYFPPFCESLSFSRLYFPSTLTAIFCHAFYVFLTSNSFIRNDRNLRTITPRLTGGKKPTCLEQDAGYKSRTRTPHALVRHVILTLE